MQYNIANLPALMLRETPMLGVSTMMLHHLSVTFKTYLMFVWCALRCVLRRASCEASVDLASTWGVGAKILACEFAHGCFANFVASEGCISFVPTISLTALGSGCDCVREWD